MTEADADPSRRPNLRRGWTTGAAAAAAARAAYEALNRGQFPDPVAITLPGGVRPSFALALAELGEGFARAGIIKDAGDDPDVTHGALVIARVSHGPPGSGVNLYADIRSVIETARRRAIGVLDAIRLTLDGKPLANGA